MSLSGLILLPILTKTLPIEDYGTYVQITVTIGLVPAVVMLGLPYTMVRYLAAAKTREEIQEGYYSITIITTLTAGATALVLFILAEPVASALFDGQVFVTQILAAIIFLECMNGLQFNYFRTFQQIKRYSSLTFFKTGLQMVLTGALILAGYGIIGAVFGLLISDAVLLIVMSISITSEIGLVYPKFRKTREYISFGIPTVPGNISSWVVNSSDRYLIAIFLGTAYVGYYSPGYTLGNMISMFIAPLSFMLPAVLSKHYDDGNLDGVKTILSYSLKYYLVLSIPSIVGLTLLSKPLLNILSTSDIASNGYLITPLVAIGAFFYGIYSIAVQVIFLGKKTRYLSSIWIIAAGLNILLNIAFIPVFGIIGAAVTTLIAFFIATIYTVYRSKMLSIVIIDRRFFAKCCISSFILGVFIIAISPWNFAELLVTILCGACIYLATLIILRGFSREEILFFKKMLRV